MFEITTNPVPVTAAKRRAEPVILTNRHCEKRVEVRDKLYDRKAVALCISRTTSGMTTFNFQIWDRFTSKVRGMKIGVYNPETFNVDHARAAVYALRARIGAGENVFETVRQHKAMKAKQGLTVDQLIELRIDWMSEEETKEDGEKRPRIETWENVARHLRRLVSPTLGKKLAVEVTRSEVAKLSNDIVAGKYAGKPSVANARHMRRAISGLYDWAGEAGNDYVPVDCRPAANLPKLPKEPPRERVLDAGEIKTLWHGLDRDDLPYDRKTCLALKFALVTMLRSNELLSAHRDELFDLDGANARFDVPLKRLKKRRVIQQPLSSLAVEIVREALTARELCLYHHVPEVYVRIARTWTPEKRKAVADGKDATSIAPLLNPPNVPLALPKPASKPNDDTLLALVREIGIEKTLSIAAAVELEHIAT